MDTRGGPEMLALRAFTTTYFQRDHKLATQQTGFRRKVEGDQKIWLVSFVVALFCLTSSMVLNFAVSLSDSISSTVMVINVAC
jgi:hypothetical protein